MSTDYNKKQSTVTEDDLEQDQGSPEANAATQDAYAAQNGPQSQPDGDPGGGTGYTPPSAQTPQPGLLDQVLSYPKAALGGYAEEWNRDPFLVGKVPALNEDFGADMAKHPNVSAAGGMLGHAFNGPQLIPGVQIRPEMKGDLYGQGGLLSGPDKPTADSTLGSQTGKDGGVIAPPPQNGSGIDPKLLDSLMKGANPMPMVPMRTDGSDKGYDDQIAAEKQAADAQVKANDETTPLYKEQADYQKGLREKYGAQGDQALADQRTFMQKAAAATDAYEQQQIDPEHYWNSMSAPKKIWTMASMIIGGMGSGITHGPNQAAERISQEIERDTQAQLQNRNAHLNAAHENGTLAGIAGQHFQNIHQQAAFLNGMKLGETASLINHIAGKYNDPVIQARAKAAAGALLAAKDKAFNEAAKAENQSRVESAHAGAMMRQATTGMLQQLLEAQKLQQNDAARYVPGAGYAHSPQEAEDVRKGLANEAAARDAITRAQTVAKKTGITSGTTQVDSLKASIAGILPYLPPDEQKALGPALEDPRIANNSDILNQVLAQLDSMHKANVGRLDQGARGNNVQYSQ